MRICFIGDGRSIHARRWVAFFAEKGHEVHLITYDPMPTAIAGVTEHVLRSVFNNLYLDFIPRQREVRRLVRQIKPDLIHAHFIAKYGFHLLGLGYRPPFVVSAWGDDILVLPQQSILIAFATGKVLQSADLVYAVSKNIRERIITDFSVPGSKVRYLPFGIDTDLFSPKNPPAPDTLPVIRVFSNRSFLPVYDNETLVRGFSKAYRTDPRLRLTLRAEGPLENDIRKLMASEDLSEVVTIQKRTSFSRVPADYREADIFITTSVSDGTPVSLLEAMACGLPCIGTRVGGIPEWIEHDRTGLLIPPRSPERVADALLTLAADPDLRSRMGTAARDVVVKNGRWSDLMAKAEKDYQELVKTYRQNRP